jgi:hypothetical protein
LRKKAQGRQKKIAEILIFSIFGTLSKDYMVNMGISQMAAGTLGELDKENGDIVARCNTVIDKTGEERLMAIDPYVPTFVEQIPRANP